MRRLFWSVYKYTMNYIWNTGEIEAWYIIKDNETVIQNYSVYSLWTLKPIDAVTNKIFVWVCWNVYMYIHASESNYRYIQYFIRLITWEQQWNYTNKLRLSKKYKKFKNCILSLS